MRGPGQKLFGQAGFADAAVADQQHQVRLAAGLRSGPGRVQGRPLGLATHQPGFGKPVGPPRARGRRGRQQRGIRGLGGWAGRDPQFALQHTGGGMVDMDGSGPVARGRLEAHQIAITGLVQGIFGYQALRRSKRRRIVLRRFQYQNQPFERGHEAPPQVFAHRQHPLRAGQA